MRIVVLAGGTSTERDVSLVSGSKIYKALKENGHSVILLDVYLGYSFDNSRMGIDDIFDLDKDWAEGVSAVAEINPDVSKVKALRADGDKRFFGPNVIDLCQSADIVFMALHGENGENGKIQACFDLMGIKYTGTDYVSSAMAMNKSITKDMFKAWEIPSPLGVHMTKEEYLSGVRDKGISFPLIVKACSGGSSIGCAIAKEASQYEDALKEAFKYDNEVVIEQFIKGRELTVGVINGKAMPIVEIAPKIGFYDYKNKYQVGATEDTCPALISEEMTLNIQKCAEKAFEALRLKSYARFDFILDEESGKFYCLEGNTLPGMTPTSLVPQEAAVMGYNFNELCELIIKVSLEKN